MPSLGDSRQSNLFCELPDTAAELVHRLGSWARRRAKKKRARLSLELQHSFALLDNQFRKIPVGLRQFVDALKRQPDMLFLVADQHQIAARLQSLDGSFSD